MSTEVGSGAGPEAVAIGLIGRPRGLDGQCHVQPYGQTLEALPCPVDVLIGEQPALTRPITLVQARRISGELVCRFDGIADRTAAETIKGQTVFIDRHRLPPPQDGRYYQFELEGMTVCDGDTVIGTVTAVHNYPSADALEIRREGAGNVIVPMIPGTVRSVDREKRRIDVNGSMLFDAR